MVLFFVNELHYYYDAFVVSLTCTFGTYLNIKTAEPQSRKEKNFAPLCLRGKKSQLIIQKAQVCDARNDAIKTTVGNKNIY